ncbi:protein DPCD [Denticeps clupeoides]|uniref:Protein DPCD n=1 Tax=Denticeps clupeoides TaxID=299321 RepID=A0AAY4F0K3_9TELE|nr:protein DPCD [Denticeps clupeoides]
MAAESWKDVLKSARKTALIHDDKRKVHYLFTDGSEMAEEYDLRTDELILRKWRRRSTLGGQGPWEVEVGESHSPQVLSGEPDLLKENISNPIFMRKDTKTSFQWRVRNLPYPKEVYTISLEAADRSCVIRTSNKKYYKKFIVPDLDRCKLPLESSALTYTHANNTLIVSYKKPKEILDFEQELLKELKKLKATKEDDNDCRTQ